MICDCSPDDLFDMESPGCQSTSIRKARKAHRCCECHEPILPGQRYEYTSGVWDGAPDAFKTCLACVAIRTRYCPNGSFLGHLRYHIQDCLGFDYTEVPEGD
jgi:hypothetical protein